MNYLVFVFGVLMSMSCGKKPEPCSNSAEQCPPAQDYSVPASPSPEQSPSAEPKQTPKPDAQSKPRKVPRAELSAKAASHNFKYKVALKWVPLEMEEPPYWYVYRFDEFTGEEIQLAFPPGTHSFDDLEIRKSGTYTYTLYIAQDDMLKELASTTISVANDLRQ